VLKNPYPLHFFPNFLHFSTASDTAAVKFHYLNKLSLFNFSNNCKDNQHSFFLRILQDKIEDISFFHADKEHKIVVYSKAGSMCKETAQTLSVLGYTNIWNLAE